jgi:hypothetical protein
MLMQEKLGCSRAPSGGNSQEPWACCGIIADSNLEHLLIEDPL